MVGWHYQLNGHEFEQAPGVGGGQGSLVCCSLRGRKESDMTEWLNRTDFVIWGIPDGSLVKNPAMQETWVQSLGWEDSLEKETATHSNILAWKTPCTEEPGKLQSIGSQRVRHDWSNVACTHMYINILTCWFQTLQRVEIYFPNLCDDRTLVINCQGRYLFHSDLRTNG